MHADDEFLAFLPEEEDISFQSNQLEKIEIVPKTENDRGLLFIRNFAPWIDSSKNYSPEPVVRLTEEIHDFVSFISPTKQEHYARNQVVERVRNVVNRVFGVPAKKEIEVMSFGSFDTLLYLPSSDIDIVVIWETEKVMDVFARPPLKKLARALVKCGVCDSGRCKTLLNARVPIIKFTDRATNFRVDISFNTKGSEGTRLINEMILRFPALRPLTFLLKLFLSQRSLNEPFTGGVGSYALICMLVSFFQNHPLIQSKLIDPLMNLGPLLLDFLELYGKHFNYEFVGISVTDSGYFDKIEREWNTERRGNQMAIQDPQDPENDLCKSSYCFNSVRQSFEHALRILIYVLNGSLNKGTSILASIVSISDETLRHRFYIKQVVNMEQ